MNEDIGLDVNDAERFLKENMPNPVTDVILLGEGAWSRCFGFNYKGEELVIRFGKYVEDFEKDQVAHRYATPDLPVPEVREIGTFDDLYYAISTWVHGVPLESVNSEQWRQLVPALVAAMEAMRTADISSTSGVGGWGLDGNAGQSSWRERLLSVDQDISERRDYGWRQRLVEAAPEEGDTFVWGYELLGKWATDDVPRSLLHCDLMNRNVLVEGNHLTGVFDWGCSIYGDHLYELAGIEFWAPWFPQLDIPYLRTELEGCWRDVGYTPENMAQRLITSYLYIGLEHIAYNAYLGDWPTLKATADRMRNLVEAAKLSNFD